MKKKCDFGLVIIAVFVVITGILFFCDRQIGTEGTLSISDTADAEDKADSSFGESESIEIAADTVDTWIYVYVCGCVNRPDVYRMASDARMFEAIEAAGGAGDDADLDRLNLAASLQDGEKVYVPVVGETEMPSESLTVQDADGRLNINTATSEQLQTLPGIGEAKANAIIAYREAQGTFSSIEELMKVPGIKDGVYGQIQSLIRVD